VHRINPLKVFPGSHRLGHVTASVQMHAALLRFESLAPSGSANQAIVPNCMSTLNMYACNIFKLGVLQFFFYSDFHLILIHDVAPSGGWRHAGEKSEPLVSMER